LSKGILLTTKQTLTILLVGETGVGKTALLDLVANLLGGLEPTTYRSTHNAANEAGGSKVGSQTNEALLYELTSLNGIKVRVLDTPGLADMRGMEHDEKHKASIACVIRDTIPSIDGILILANGTTERLQAATDYAITTLASIFPRSIADNIAIVFTMVANPMSFNFQLESLPESLGKSEQYTLDNPIALMKRYREFEQKPAHGKQLPRLLKMVKDAHNEAVDIFADFFDWLDKRTVQPTAAIVELYDKVCTIERSIQNALARMSIISEKKRDVESIRSQMSKSTQVNKNLALQPILADIPLRAADDDL
jgi:GTPase SAR1 family protein